MTAKLTTRQKARASKDPAIAEMSNELDTFTALDVLAESEGGKILIANLSKDIIATVEVLTSQYAELSLEKFISYSAKMKEKLSLLRVLTRAKDNKKFVTDEIETLLAEALPD